MTAMRFSGSQGQYAVVGQQDDRLCDGLTGQRALLWRVECRLGGLRIHVGLLEEPERKLQPQDAPHGCVDDLKWPTSSLNLGFEWRAIEIRRRKLHVEPCRQRQSPLRRHLEATHDGS